MCDTEECLIINCASVVPPKIIEKSSNVPIERRANIYKNNKEVKTTRSTKKKIVSMKKLCTLFFPDYDHKLIMWFRGIGNPKLYKNTKIDKDSVVGHGNSNKNYN